MAHSTSRLFEVSVSKMCVSTIRILSSTVVLHIKHTVSFNLHSATWRQCEFTQGVRELQEMG